MKLSKIFSVLWFVTFLLTLAETFKYKGFLNAHFGIGILSVLSIYIFFVLIFFKEKIFGKLGRNIILLELILSAVSIGTFVVFDSLEKNNYPNFVYSKYRLNFEGIKYIFFFFFVNLILSFIYEFKSKIDVLKIKRELSITVIKTIVKNLSCVIFITLILFGNVISIYRNFNKRIFFMINRPRSNYSEKMSYVLGKGFFEYMEFVKRNTPKDSVILIPPQGYPWPQTGNKYYVRYFLYPRKLINAKEFTDGGLIKKVDYVMVVEGESESTQYGYTHGWPKFNVPAEGLIIKDKGEIKGDYIYKPGQLFYKWGLIKVKK